jgi:hypothetical protein
MRVTDDGIGTSGRRMYGRLITVLVVASTLAACSPGASNPASTAATDVATSATPPRTELPGEPVSPSSESVRACGTGEVAAGGVWWAGATASVQGGVVLYSIAEHPCTIAGPIALRLVADGQELSLETTYRRHDGTKRIVLAPGLGAPSPLGGLVAGRAQVLVTWWNWCGRRAIGPAKIEVDLDGVGTLDAPFGRTSAPRCDNPGDSSTLFVEPLSPQEPDE